MRSELALLIFRMLYDLLPLSDHLVLSLSGELTVQSNLVNMDTEAASILSRDGTRIFQSGSRTHMSGQIGVPSILGGPQNLGDPPLRNSFCCCYEKE